MTPARIVPWFSRAVLLAALAVLALIGRKFVGDPVGSATASGITLGTPLALTNMRASFGAFPLGCSLFVLVCLVTASLRRTGLIFVMLVIGTALAVRVFGIIVDGTFGDSLRVLAAETVLFCLCFAAYSAERLTGGNPESRRA